MPNADDCYRLYGDLADWWPLISPPGEYAEEAAYLAAILSSAAAFPVHDVLDLGSGGGHVAMHLKARFRLTLVDISDDMLAVSQRLNPECPHMRADMRTTRLPLTFDAVLVHDAIDYVTTQDDLALVIATVFAHCRPGGIAVFVPDYVKDDFHQLSGSGGGGTDGTGRQATFQEKTWDPDPADDWVQADYEFSLREADGSVEVIKESHRLGAFGRDAWHRLLTEAGFTPGPETAFAPGPETGFALGPGVTGRATPGRRPANLFLAHRPS